MCHDLFSLLYATATPVIYTLSLHDALPILNVDRLGPAFGTVIVTDNAGNPTGFYGASASIPVSVQVDDGATGSGAASATIRSEEHTSELQSRQYLVCRLLLEKKKKSEYHTD